MLDAEISSVFQVACNSASEVLVLSEENPLTSQLIHPQ